METQLSIDNCMQPHSTRSDNSLVRIFAENPLIGNKRLSEKYKRKLFEYTKGYIDQRIESPLVEFPPQVNMQIALAVITFAKEWDYSDESAFWAYITSQFGYRDDTGEIRNILSQAVYLALKYTDRWFISSKSGNYYKSTIVVHALSPKRSWMYLCDFLFDFYKNNLHWTYVPGDPLVERMVRALRAKLSTDDKSDEDKLEISNKYYLFQEGICKLVRFQPGYSVKLFSRMLERIDALINHKENDAELYVDELCDKWLAGKLTDDAAVDKERKHYTREIAFDYTRIFPRYVLKDETEVFVTFPDIRLSATEFSKVTLKVSVGDDGVEEQPLSYYGNELGKTLNGFAINVENCISKGDGSLHLRTELFCDEEKIYDSGHSLYRKILCFRGKKECDVNALEPGSYSVFCPRARKLDFEHTDVSDIETIPSWNAYFVKLEAGFAVTSGTEILAFDGSQTDAGTVLRAMEPGAVGHVGFSKDGHQYQVLAKPENVILLAHEKPDPRKVIISMNGKAIHLSGLQEDVAENRVAYLLPLEFNEEGLSEYQVIDLENDRILVRNAYKLVPGISVRFSREYYFEGDDFSNAAVTVALENRPNAFFFGPQDEYIRIPVDDGRLEISIPKISILSSERRDWSASSIYWINDIHEAETIQIVYPEDNGISLRVGGMEVSSDESGKFPLGKAVLSYANVEANDGQIDVKLFIDHGSYQKSFTIGRIATKEQFVSEPSFEFFDNNLYWNHGKGFLGNRDASLLLRLSKGNWQQDFPLDLAGNLVLENPQIDIGQYDYQIIKSSDNIFLQEEKVMAQGSLFIGDRNALRFQKSLMQVTHLTYMDGEKNRRVELHNTFIDQIEYQGIQFVDSEGRECPVYKGTLFYTGSYGTRHEFSVKAGNAADGTCLSKVNPVTVIYINDGTIGITDEDGDGLYFVRTYNETAMANFYQLTDIEPTAKSQSAYNTADLYGFKKVKEQ